MTKVRSAFDANLRRRLLRDMSRIRLIEETIAAKYHEQQMRCPVHLSIGQEAVAVGVCAALEGRDAIMSTHRAHAHYLAKGGDLKAMIAEIYGKATGCSSGKGGSMHLIDLAANMMGSTPIVGGSLPVAVGLAFGAWLQKQARVTAVFFGDAATEEGSFCESLNFAALKKLPVIFVCENNLYSVYSPLSVRQPPARDRVALARAHGLAAAKGDGNDVETVLGLTRAAVARARGGKGPTYLEFATYRWREHCGPNYDNDIGYRTEAEFQAWHKRCPVERYRTRLLKDRAVSESELSAMTARISRETAAAFAFAQSSPLPEPNDLGDEVYAPENTRG